MTMIVFSIGLRDTRAFHHRDQTRIQMADISGAKSQLTVILEQPLTGFPIKSVHPICIETAITHIRTK